MAKSNGEEIEVIIQRGNEEKVFHFKPMEEKYNYTGIAISGKQEDTTKIAAIASKSPSSKQGLEVNDIIVAINDITVKDDSIKMVEEINKNIGEPIKFTIERENQTIDIEIVPEVKANYYMGVYLQKAENNFGNNVYYAFFKSGEFAFSVIDNIKLLFTGNVSIDQMIGPVGIGEVITQTNGFADFIYILAVVSISLGFTNLLPFPPLDGGKVIILLIEAIRRKPLKEKTEITIQMIGFMLLIGLAVLVTYNDILRIF